MGDFLRKNLAVVGADFSVFLWGILRKVGGGCGDFVVKTW